MYQDPRRGARLGGSVARYRSGVTRLSLFPQSFDGILNMLVRTSRPVIVVTYARYFTWDNDRRADESLAGLARSRGVACHGQGPRADPEIIAIDRIDLPALLEGIYQWNFVCWDVSNPPSPATLRKQREVMEHVGNWWGDTAALHMVDRAHLFVSSHDNDSLIIEARTPAFVHAVFARAVQTLVATPDPSVRARLPHAVADVPLALIEELWERVPAFELRVATPSSVSGRVRIAFDAGGPVLPIPSKDFQPRGYLDYEVATGVWKLRHQ